MSARFIVLFSCLVAFAARPAQLSATVIAPIGLAPGSQYQLIFVTGGTQPPVAFGGTRDGTSSNIADYNAFVTAQAALNPLLPITTWHAVASTATVNANSNAPSIGLPVYNTHGLEVASAATGLYTPSLLTQILYDQNGLDGYATVNPGGTVWTGSDTSGHVLAPLGVPHSTYGISEFTNAGWINSGSDLNPANNFPFHFYALSDPTTFVPEPSSIALAALGFASVALWRWRR